VPLSDDSSLPLSELLLLLLDSDFDEELPEAEDEDRELSEPLDDDPEEDPDSEDEDEEPLRVLPDLLLDELSSSSSSSSSLSEPLLPLLLPREDSEEEEDDEPLELDDDEDPLPTSAPPDFQAPLPERLEDSLEPKTRGPLDSQDLLPLDEDPDRDLLEDPELSSSSSSSSSLLLLPLLLPLEVLLLLEPADSGASEYGVAGGGVSGTRSSSTASPPFAPAGMLLAPGESLDGKFSFSFSSSDCPILARISLTSFLSSSVSGGMMLRNSSANFML